MSLGILLVRCIKPRLGVNTIFATSNFRSLRFSSSKSFRKPFQQRQTKKRSSVKPSPKREIPLNLARVQQEPIAYIPKLNDYPDLKKWMFTQPWDAESWNKATNLGSVSRGISRLKQNGAELWKFSFQWLSRSGESFTVACVGSSKLLARKDAAFRLLAALHEKGILNDISREIVEYKDKKSASQIEEKETITLGSQMRTDVYNYGASILAIPQVEIIAKKSRSRTRSKPSGYTVTLKLEERNIEIEESGASLVKTELKVYSKFRKLIEEYHEKENIPNTSLTKETSSLDNSRGKEFIFYYKRKVSKTNMKGESSDQVFFSIKHEQKGSLISAQVCMDGEIIGAPVFARKSKEAEELAYLTAAIYLAKKQPLIWKMFLNEQRSSNGEIIQQFIQVPLQTNRAILKQISETASPIINVRFNQNASLDVTRNSDSIRPRRPFRSNLSFEEERSRNEVLKAQFESYNLNPQFQKLRELKNSLPMNKYKSEVLKLVNENTFCVIVGETGSGKTTQVPAIIFEEAIVKGKGASVNIMCTQPRRIAAKSVAIRVAYERGEKLQDTVGYHVYLDVKRPSNKGSICYCTTEILLKQLQNNPDEAMDTISHIIVDEAHERDIPIDFLFITLKKVIQARRAMKKSVPKVIIMSATLNISLFANYFGELMADGTTIPCPSLTVPGKTYPVRRVYLNDLLKELYQNYGNKTGLQNCSVTQRYLEIERSINDSPNTQSIQNKFGDRISWRANDTDEALIPHTLVAATVAHVVRSSLEGAILVFLPGLKDLEDVQKSLLRKPLDVDFSDNNKYKVVLLHSLMKDAQNSLFEPTPGCRKIILATNIAETSITIPDVRHVIDTGKLNEMNFDPVTRIKNLKCTWASKSNSRQRSGRAGRVQNGFYYALFTEDRFNSFRDCGLPQLLRSDLQDVCLSAKGQTLQYSIQEFLADAIEKPSSQAVDAAIKDLIQLGALTRDEEITPLGRLLHSLPVDPDLGKMVVLGVIFRCLDPLLTLAAAESEKDFFMRPISARKEADQARFSFGRNTFSDAITTIKAFRHARHARRTMNRHDYMSVMIQKFLNAGTVETIEKKMFQIEEVLVSSGVIPRAIQSPNSTSFYCGHYMLNENSDNQSLIKALTLARCPGNLAVRIGTSSRFRTKTESGIQIRTGLNGTRFGQKSLLPRTALISYASIYKDDASKLCLRDTNLVNPIAAALFGGTLESRFRKLVTDDWIIYSTPGEQEDYGCSPYNNILGLRTALNKILSNSFLDLAKRQNLLDDRMRRNFTSAIAQILSDSDNLLRVEEQHTEDTNDSKARIERSDRSTSPQRSLRHKTLQPFVRDLLTEIEYRKTRTNAVRQRNY
ncbi:putative atp-dependent rna helicase a [Erysiphe necator]|uniref:RNA helicase n=1 Tax=Uncinula necator TaxID=52586 RepID=A0A0B1P8W5_UNCNE|nr:putative atp-dependent rna helicase a [Erysiphe necator]